MYISLSYDINQIMDVLIQIDNHEYITIDLETIYVYMCITACDKNVMHALRGICIKENKLTLTSPTLFI